MNEQDAVNVLVPQIEAEAFRLGFCLFGATSADPLQNHPIYEGWLAAGLNGGMKYLESERHRKYRQDPHLLFGDVKSIVVLGWPYALTKQTEKRAGGWIAGYATQPDYHERLKEPLSALADFINEKSGCKCESRIYTDSAPILERELGERAGLGWIAKNSCLISPRAGSNFLLAEIFLSIRLPESAPFAGERCGTCRRCIDACPTHCILEDRTIDAGKCISYLTIENKGAIPLELREAVGEWLFGCDVCQSVCPWNTRNGKLEHAPEIDARMSREDMVQNIALGEEDFKAKFSGSPILRAKRKGLLRNLATVLTNEREVTAIPALKRLMESQADADLWETLRWALDTLEA